MIETEFRIGASTLLAAKVLSGSAGGGRADLTIEVAHRQWETIDMLMLFHTEWGDRNEGEIVGNGDVQLELRLDGNLVAEFEALVNGGDVAEIVAGLGFQHLLKSTEAWYALTVTEAVPLPPELVDKGELRSGFTTVWNDRQLPIDLPDE